MACVRPLANRIIGSLTSWFEGSGYTPKAFCDSNTRSFYDAVISIGEEAYLDARSAAYVVSTGLGTDVEGGSMRLRNWECPKRATWMQTSVSGGGWNPSRRGSRRQRRSDGGVAQAAPTSARRDPQAA